MDNKTSVNIEVNSHKYNAKDYPNYQELGHKIRSQFVRQNDCNVHFFIGPKSVKMSAHKSVLKNVLTSLTSLMSEFDGNIVIHNSDLSHDNFKAMLRFVYNYNIIINKLNVSQLYSIAEKYGINSLKSCCDDFERSQINKDNVIHMLINAIKSEDHKLVEHCLQIIDINCNHIITSEAFLKLTSNQMSLILKRDQLIVNEIDLLKALIKWSENLCFRRGLQVNGENIFRIMEKKLYLIRFPLLKLDEMIECLTTYGILPQFALKNYVIDLLIMNVRQRGKHSHD